MDTPLHRAVNQPRLGDFNQSVILDAIRRAPAGLSRTELSAATGLMPGSITAIVRRLVEEGFVEELGAASGSGARGKPRMLLGLRGESRYAIGVHLDPTVMTFVLLDLAGRVVARTTRRTPRVVSPDDVVQKIAAELDALVRESGVDIQRIAGVGIAAPGPIDELRGALMKPPHLESWDNVPLRDETARSFGLDTSLEKDVIAAATGEMWAAGAERHDFLFVYLGTGLGAGLVVGGEVVRGASGNAGEMGHIAVEPLGPACWCGQVGCVAVSAVPQHLVAEAVRHGVLDYAVDSADLGAVDAAFTDLAEAAARGQETARAILRAGARRTALAIGAIVNLFDVDRVLLGGPFWERMAPVYLAEMPSVLEEVVVTRSVHELTLGSGAVGDDVAAVGAASLVLNSVVSPRVQALMLDRPS